MSTLCRHGMILMVESASTYDLERGLDAARAIFATAGVTAREAWDAASEMESHCQCRLDGKCELAPDVQERAALWVLAFDDALSTCCGGGVPPPGADLSLASGAASKPEVGLPSQ